MHKRMAPTMTGSRWCAREPGKWRRCAGAERPPLSGVTTRGGPTRECQLKMMEAQPRPSDHYELTLACRTSSGWPLCQGSRVPLPAHRIWAEALRQVPQDTIPCRFSHNEKDSWSCKCKMYGPHRCIITFRMCKNTVNFMALKSAEKQGTRRRKTKCRTVLRPQTVHKLI